MSPARLPAVFLLLAPALASAQVARPAAPPGGESDRAGYEAPPPLAASAPQPSPAARNLEGTWYRTGAPVFQITQDRLGGEVPLNAAGHALLDERLRALRSGRPQANAAGVCLPLAQPLQMAPSPFLVFQSGDLIEVQFQDFHGRYEIVLNGAAMPPPGYMGQSRGRWEGDTLLVETTGFKAPFGIDFTGTPASAGARLTQRIRKVKTDHWFLEVQYTLDDPTYYTRPWSWTVDYDWRPDMTLLQEYNCEVQVGAPASKGPDATSSRPVPAARGSKS